MSKNGYKIDNPDGVYFITFAVVQWLDVFTRNEYTNIVVESLRYCQVNKGLEINAWSIMSNHLHLICSAKDGNLSDIRRDFKTYTSKEIIKAIQLNERVLATR